MYYPFLREADRSLVAKVAKRPGVSEWTWECLAIDMAGSLGSGRVIEVLIRLVSLHDAPRDLRQTTVQSSCHAPFCGGC
jgi:hypothetical protein